MRDMLGERGSLWLGGGKSSGFGSTSRKRRDRGLPRFLEKLRQRVAGPGQKKSTSKGKFWVGFDPEKKANRSPTTRKVETLIFLGWERVGGPA